MIVTTFADKQATKEKARLIAERETTESSTRTPTETPTPDLRARPKWTYYPSSSGKPTTPPPAPTDTTHISQLRADLATANNIRAEQESKLKIAKTETSDLQATRTQQMKRISELEKQARALEIKVRNNAEELVGQRKLAREAQDEMLALQVEMNAKDKRLQKVEADNKMLVDRWMTEKGEAAQRMNEAMEKEQKKR
jgi:DNA repair exonuclease SbcCD ATPase subunit